jgi:anti-sigma regulatory factor (Ser/Thr protein kinase)
MIAAASTVSGLRAEFAEWLRPGPAMDDTRLCDVVLAVNEALANAAEFAYAEGESGTLDVEAVRDVGRRTITVTVSDRGRWRETDLLHRHPSRGRGIPLMRTLADSMIISTSGLGTSVCLRFDEVRSEGPLPAGSC